MKRNKIEFSKGSRLYPIMSDGCDIICFECDGKKFARVKIILPLTGIYGMQCKKCQALYAEKRDITFALNLDHCGAKKE